MIWPLHNTRADAWLFYRSLTGKPAWRDIERELGRRDLFYLLVRLLRRNDINRDWLFDRCREVQRNPNGHLDLWMRGGYKSSIITYGLTIQDILRNPDITIGIFSHTRPIAKGFLSQIKREFEQNEYLKYLYSEVLWQNPAREAPRWSEDAGLIVKRRANPKEATLEAHGVVDGQPTSRHFDLLIFDDIVTLESVSTADQVQKTTKALELAFNLIAQGGVMRFIGTRYSLMDTYQELLQRGTVTPRIYPATHNGRMDGRPVLFTEEEWQAKLKSMSRATVAAQLLQNPMADEAATFRPEWLRSYEVRPKTVNVYITCDPSRGRSSTSDSTAISVIGLSASGAKFLLDGVCHRMSLSQRWQKLRGLYVKWSRAVGVQHVAVGYERYGAQSDDEYFQEQMQREGLYFTIEELSWPRDGTNSKRERVERLEPEFRNSRFYLPAVVWRDSQPQTWKVMTDPDAKDFGEVKFRPIGGLTQIQMRAIDEGMAGLVAKPLKCVDQESQIYDLTSRFIEEYSSFPFGEHKDLIDAASRLYDLNPYSPLKVDPERTEPPVFWDT